MASLLGITAALWGIVMALAPLLQVRRMIARRSSADLSLGYFGVLLPGFALWVAYAWTRGDFALLVPNAVAFSVGTATLLVGLALRRRQRPGTMLTATAQPDAPKGAHDDW